MKKKEKFEDKKKWFKPSPILKASRSFWGNNYNRINNQHNIPMQSGTKNTRFVNNKPSKCVREPLKCWGFNGPHIYKNCPYNNNRKSETINNVQESSRVNDIARNIPWINVAFEDKQVDHLSTMDKIEGKFYEKIISILIDLGPSLCYVSPFVVDFYKL